jgi:hypothetical protein
MQILTTFKDSLKQTWKYSILIWLCVWLFGYCAYILLPIRHEYQGFPWFKEQGFDFFNTIRNLWDTLFFTRIAEQGYITTLDHTGNLDYLFAFFPGTPSVIGVISFIIGSVFAPVLYSLIGLILLGAVFRNTSAILLIDLNSWKWLYVIPFSIFLFVPYTEGLFVLILLLILGVLYNQTYRPIVSNTILLFLGILGSLTRSVTLLLSVSIGIVGLVFWIKNKQNADKLFLIKSVFLGIGSGIGLGLVVLLNQIGSGSWNTFLQVQAYWGRTISGGRFWDPIIRAISETFSGNPSFSLFTLIGYILVYIIIYFVKPVYTQYKKLYWISLVFSMLINYTTVSQNTLQSINRYLFATPVVLLLLPHLLEKYIPNKFKNIVYILGFCFLLLTAGLFFRHYWVG